MCVSANTPFNQVRYVRLTPVLTSLIGIHVLMTASTEQVGSIVVIADRNQIHIIYGTCCTRHDKHLLCPAHYQGHLLKNMDSFNQAVDTGDLRRHYVNVISQYCLEFRSICTELHQIATQRYLIVSMCHYVRAFGTGLRKLILKHCTRVKCYFNRNEIKISMLIKREKSLVKCAHGSAFPIERILTTSAISLLANSRKCKVISFIKNQHAE